MEWILIVMLVWLCFWTGLWTWYHFKVDNLYSNAFDRIESKLDRLIEVLGSDNSPNLPSAEDVRGIFKRKDGKDE